MAADTPEPSETREGRGEVPWGTARELSDIASGLQERESDLDARERVIAERELDLQTLEASLMVRLEELETVRAEVQALLDGLDSDSEDRVTDLVRRVEVMRDTQAAAVLAETDRELAVEVLRRMSPGKAGKALAKMEPATAADLGERMAARLEPPR